MSRDYSIGSRSNPRSWSVTLPARRFSARMCLDKRINPRLLVSLNGAFMPFGGMANQLISPLTRLLVMNPLVPRAFAWQASHAGAVERLIRNTGSTIDAEGIAQYRKLVRSPAHVAAALRMMANWRLEPLLHDLPRLMTSLLLIVADNDRSISPVVADQVREVYPQAADRACAWPWPSRT